MIRLKELGLMLCVSLMMSDRYWIVGLDGLSVADREELLLEATAEHMDKSIDVPLDRRPLSEAG